VHYISLIYLNVHAIMLPFQLEMSILCLLTLTWKECENAALYAAYQCSATNHALRVSSSMFFIAAVATPLLITLAQP
jgi:hypothetical protein